MNLLPEHLKKYIVDQDYSRYTPVDQAVWRYILRQLKDFLSKNAHPCYVEGLEKTGISTEEIPRIEEMSTKLEKFGWRALAVSGFIPPAAFMELQSLSVLPIACDIRSIDHLLYTPAPDIVHEAAGHAPILIEPEYAQYLKEYAQIAKKAIISKEDLDLYEAIRELSDIKENPLSTKEQIATAEKNLIDTTKAMTHVSEASELSRMNWWTAEYGLIGDIKNPKIFGAGLLSSVGESHWCLSESVKKIPLTVDCIKQSYDITEPQPQLFVAKDFKNLVQVLHEMAEQMAFKVGGLHGLNKALQAQSVNTIQLDSGLQISGILSRIMTTDNNEPCFIQLKGPTQLSFNDQEIAGHGKNYHEHGYSFPIGKLTVQGQMKPSEWVTLIYESGVIVKGKFVQTMTVGSDLAQIFTLTECTVSYKNEILFQPDWGNYDIAVGLKVTSVFGGPADRKKYGMVDDFVAARVPKPQYSDRQKIIFDLFSQIRELRTNIKLASTEKSLKANLEDLFSQCEGLAVSEWLLFVELLEIAEMLKTDTSFKKKIIAHLELIKKQNSKLTSVIDDGVRLACVN